MKSDLKTRHGGKILADSLVGMVPPESRAAERQYDDMLVAAVLAQASKEMPALADSARRLAKRSEGDATTDPTRDNAYVGAFVYTTLGVTANAVRLLKAYIAANPERAGTLRDDPGWWFRPLQGNREFRALVSAVPAA